MDPAAAAPLWYFAYGSNMTRETFEGRRGLRPLAVRWGWVAGHRLCFDIPVGPGERGVANLAADPDARVCGVLYLLRPEDAERLDRSEGVHVGFYRRILVTAVASDGETLDAFAYESSFRNADRKPSPRYIGLLLAGAREQSLPADWVRHLEGLPLAVDERRPKGDEPMAEKRVRFYFAYNSPYAFLASQRLARELGPTGAVVEYKPVYQPRTGPGPDRQSPRIRYILEDVARFADAYGLALRPGPFADTKKACLGFFFARDQGRERDYHDGVYRARWLEERSLGDDDTLAGVATACGLDRAAFLDAIHGERYEPALERSNEDARADGLFGFPFFVWNGQRFWGNDRLEWLVRALERA
jgi:2-hydroxychromene-2-carboxylate isomerase